VATPESEIAIGMDRGGRRKRGTLSGMRSSKSQDSHQAQGKQKGWETHKNPLLPLAYRPVSIISLHPAGESTRRTLACDKI